MNLRTHKTFRKLENRLFPFGKDDANGKWLIVSVVALILLLITSSRTYGQVVTSNPPDFVIVSPKNLRQRVWRFSDALPSALFGYKPPCSKVA